MVQVLAAMRERKAAVMRVPAESQRAYNAWLHHGLDKTVWAGSCHSWYKTASGKIVTLWPHSTTRFWWTLRQPVLSDLAFEAVAGDAAGGVVAPLNGAAGKAGSGAGAGPAAGKGVVW